MAGYIAGVLVSLGAATLLVRYLGISEFGRFVTVSSLIALVSSLTEAGIVVYGVREFGSRDERDRRRLWANLLAMRLTLAAVGILLASVFALAVGYRRVLVIGTVVAGVGLLIQVTADVLTIPLQARLRLGLLALIDLVRRAVTLALIGVLILFGVGLLPFLAVPIPAGAIALIILSRTVRSFVTITLGFDRPAWRGLLRDTLPFAVATTVGAIYLYVTVIVMSLIATAHQTGLFATAFRVTQVALGIPGLALMAVFPVMSREQDQQRRFGGILRRVFAVALIVGVWMSLCIALGAPFIMRVIAGGEGHAAIPVLRIQGLVLAASFVSSSSVFGLLSLRRYHPIVLMISAAIVVNIGLALALVPPLGAQGAAVADVVAEVAVAAALTLTLVRFSPEYHIGARFLPPLAAATLLSAVLFITPIGSVGRVVTASAIYFGLLLAAGAIPDDVINAVRGVSLSAGRRLRGTRASLRH